MGFINTEGSPLKLFRDVLAVYKKLTQESLIDSTFEKGIVKIKDTGVIKMDRAPMIILHRGAIGHEPRSLMLNETIGSSNGGNQPFSNTIHIIDYPIVFTCYGNSYLETEQLGIIALETILTAGQTAVSNRHENILGAEFVSMSEAAQVEGAESQLTEVVVVGKVTIMTSAIRNL